MIVWDEWKRQANIVKHGLDFAALSDDFFDRAVIVMAKHGRWAAINWLDSRTITTIFARYGEGGISVISMRPASAAERRLYDQEKRKAV